MSDSANGFTSQSGTDVAFLTLGPLGSGLILAQLRLVVNMSNAGFISFGAVLSKNATPAADNFAAGNSIIDRSTLAGGSKPMITFAVGKNVFHEFVVAPHIRLVTRPLYLTLRLVHDQAAFVGAYYAEALTLDRAEVQATEGLGRIIQTVGAQPLTISAAPAVPA